MGIAIARQLFVDGFSVIGCGRSTHEGRAAASEIDPLGGEVRFVTCDLAEGQGAASAIEAALDYFGRIDVVVNNAAAVDQVRTGKDRPLHEMDPADFDRMLRVGVTAPFLLARAAVPHMLRQRGGVFVHLSSVAARRALPGLTGYGTSKAALEALSSQIASDYGHLGIRSNCVRAGTIRVDANRALLDHPQAGALLLENQMLPHAGTPEDVAVAVSFLCSEASRFITASVLTVDGGFLVKQMVARAADVYSAAALADAAESG
jgi:NAD(P)-dependent dehydrogenase (short-subunit alcohol dehydrogenase family)